MFLKIFQFLKHSTPRHKHKHSTALTSTSHSSTARGTRCTAHGTHTRNKEAPTHHIQTHDQGHRTQHSTETSAAQTTKSKHDTRQDKVKEDETKKRRRSALSETPCVAVFRVCVRFAGPRGWGGVGNVRHVGRVKKKEKPHPNPANHLPSHRHAATLFAREGVFTYFTFSLVLRTLGKIARHRPGSTNKVAERLDFFHPLLFVFSTGISGMSLASWRRAVARQQMGWTERTGVEGHL